MAEEKVTSVPNPIRFPKGHTSFLAELAELEAEFDSSKVLGGKTRCIIPYSAALRKSPAGPHLTYAIYGLVYPLKAAPSP